MNADPTSLDRLHDVIAPPPVPWWPPAPGWYWLLGFLAVLIVYAGVWGFIRWQRNRYRREALAECRRQVALIADERTRRRALIVHAELLKRTAVTAFPRTWVASLTGRRLVEFLQRTCSKKPLNAEALALLERAAYDAVDGPAIDESKARESAALVCDWVTHHRATDAAQGGAPC